MVAHKDVRSDDVVEVRAARLNESTGQGGSHEVSSQSYRHRHVRMVSLVGSQNVVPPLTDRQTDETLAIPY